MSKSQLQRINAMEKLTDKVKTAIDEKIISESAALAMSNMTAEEQDACVEKIMSGEIRDTAQDIQNLSVSKVVEEVEDSLSSENVVSNLENSSSGVVVEEVLAESALEENTSPAKSTMASTSEEIEVIKESEIEQNQNVSVFLGNEKPQSVKSAIGKLIDVPEEFDDPQKEAKEWFYQERLAFYEIVYREAKRLSEEEDDELKAAQWGIRASVTRYNIEELKLQHKKIAFFQPF